MVLMVLRDVFVGVGALLGLGVGEEVALMPGSWRLTAVEVELRARFRVRLELVELKSVWNERAWWRVNLWRISLGSMLVV